MSGRSRLTRWLGVWGVGVRRSLSRATNTARQRVLFSVLGVAVAIALLVVITGLGIGLATSATVYDDDVDYWIVPDGEGESSPLIATGNPRLGDAHETTAYLRDNDEIDAVTPVLSQVLRVEGDGTDEYVLVVGVIGDNESTHVAGLETGPLTADDPYYNDGGYDGDWTGEVVLSRSAASLLEAGDDDPLTVGGTDSFSVVAVDDGQSSAGGDLPVALVQLGELQSLTGADANDQADQFVVSTTSPTVENDLDGIYAESSVLTRGDMLTGETLDSELPLALALSAFVISVSVGTLFVVTTMSLEVVADRDQLATMSAIGLSARSQLQLVGIQTVTTTALGGLLGALAGLGGILAINAVVRRTVTTAPIAEAHPLFLVYGLGAALVIALLSLPWLLFITRRVSGGVPS